MKHCPRCLQTYTDENLKFCRVDGAPLRTDSVEAEGSDTQLLPPKPTSDALPTQLLHTDTGQAIASGPPQTAMRPSQTGELKATDSINSTSSAQAIRGGIKRRKTFSVAALASLLVAFGIGGWFFFLRSPGSTATIDSIAVLPFENRSGNADSEYLSDGLTESLIYRLSQLPDLKVSPTSSVFRYKGRETDPPVIARELGVDSVLTGRVTQRGDNLTISVNLVDTRDGKSLWGEQYERRMSELLATQREITAEITNNLKIRLTGEGEHKLSKRYTDNNGAYQLYLQGRHHWSKRTKREIEKAIEYYRQAIALDSNYALAYVGIADAYNSLGKNSDLAPKDAIPPAKEAALQALEIDSSLAEAHAALADSAAIYDWDWALSEREFKRALELNPNVSYTHLAHATGYLASQGRGDEMVAGLKRALEIEPLSLINNSVLVTAYLYARQNDKALEQGRKAFELDPNFVIARQWLCEAYIANGRYDEASKLGEDGLQRPTTNIAMLYVVGKAYAKQGRRREAEQYVNRMRDEAKTGYIRTYWLACIYAALGDKDKAFAELERSYEDRDIFLPRIKSDPQMDPLRDDPRFKSLLRRMNLPE